jgi:uncharacterized protein HemX
MQDSQPAKPTPWSRPSNASPLPVAPGAGALDTGSVVGIVIGALLGVGIVGFLAMRIHDQQQRAKAAQQTPTAINAMKIAAAIAKQGAQREASSGQEGHIQMTVLQVSRQLSNFRASLH